MTKIQGLMVSPEDEDLLTYGWYLNEHGYARRSEHYPHPLTGRQTCRPVYLHRTILERMLGRPLNKDEISDHKNRNRLDCRRENLRPASRIQNARNRSVSRNNKSGHPGVHWNKNCKRWHVQLGLDGCRKYLGVYKDLGVAISVYKSAVEEIHGEFAAHLNRPHEAKHC